MMRYPHSDQARCVSCSLRIQRKRSNYNGVDRLTEFDVDESILSDVAVSEVLRTTNIQQRRER